MGKRPGFLFENNRQNGTRPAVRPSENRTGDKMDVSEQQDDILSINQVQLLLAEKRTALAVMRTGIAVLALPLSIFSALIATSKWYSPAEVWLLLAVVSLINIGLIVFAVYLIARSLMRMHQYDQLIADIKHNHSSLRKLIKS